MPTASTSAGTQKWLSVSTARRIVVFKKRSLTPMWGAIAPRLYTGARRFQSGKNRPCARLKVQADRRRSAGILPAPLFDLRFLLSYSFLEPSLMGEHHSRFRTGFIRRSPAGRGETPAPQRYSKVATFWRGQTYIK
jgi:hypothetical protein